MSNNRWFSGQNQVYWTCKALLDGRTISHKMEIREVEGWRLGAINHRLKQEFGWPICVEYRGPENIAHFELDPSCDRSKLRFLYSARELAEVA